MKRLLVIIGDYDPTPSPNSNCIAAVLDYFEDWEITILTSRFDSKVPFEDDLSGKRILRILDRHKAWYKKPWHHFRSAEKTIKKTVNYLISKVGFPDNKFFLRVKGKRLVSKMSTEKFEAVISVGLPFTDHLIAEKYVSKNPDVKWIVYMLDPFVGNSYVFTRNRFFRHRATKIEERVLKKCSGIITAPAVDIPEAFSSKHFTAGIPLLKNNTFSDTITTENYALYTGGFIKGVREPTPVLEILKEFNKLEPEISFRFYTKLDDALKTKISDYADCSNILFHDFIPKNELLHIMEKAGAFINVGNTVSNQVPSKLFEYMSFGRPIIHFYSIDKDTSILFLKDYSNACLIDVREDPEKNARVLYDFYQNKKDALSFEEIISSDLLKASMPDYTAELMKKIIG